MNIQIFGTAKCRNTQKAQRWFTERGIAFHMVDLKKKAMSPGEMDSVLRFVSADELIDEESKSYKKRGFAYMDFDPRDEMLEDPSLIRTPVVRNGTKDATAGFQDAIWERWRKEDT